MPRRTTSLPRHSFRRQKHKSKLPKLRSRPLTAAVQSTKAAVETARINLGFTRITSPIDGIPGAAQQQVGALVSPASGAITTVSTLDPIKVYFTASEQEYLEYARRFPTAEKRQANNRRLELELILADGTTYPHKGKFYFADRQVDVRTGAIRLAGLFPNPGNSLASGPVWQGKNLHAEPTRRPSGSAAGRHRPPGHASGRGSR